MVNKRPHFRKSVTDLHVLFEASKSEPRVMRELLEELKHRETAKALLLKTKVEEVLARSRETTSPPPPPPNEQVFLCRTCQTSLRVEVRSGRASFTCPRCKSPFETEYSNGIFQVQWAVGESVEQEMSEDVARRMLGVGQDADFAAIKAAWREACKQYHPDKHQNLPDRLKKAAEQEMKRINEAFQLLQRMTASEF